MGGLAFKSNLCGRWALESKNSYMVGNPDGLVFCVSIVKKYLAVRGGFLFCIFCVNHYFLKLFRTALDKGDFPGDDFSFLVKRGVLNEAKNSGKVSLSVLERHARKMAN